MKQFKNFLYPIAVLILFMGCKAQQSNLWNDFEIASKNNTEPILPDFSYAGYKYSEVGIPTVDYPIFNVMDFGANPNDTISDKEAIQKAILMAEKKGKGIVFFPAGIYRINTGEDDLKNLITIASSHIVLRGDTQAQSTLFFDKHLPPDDPNKLWTTPYAIQTKSQNSDFYLTDVIADTRRETHSVKVANASGIKKGQWLILQVKNNDKELLEYDLRPLKPEPEWTSILNDGVQVNEIHQVVKVEGNTIFFKEPIHYDIKAKFGWKLFKFSPLEAVGFENLVFEGNWKEEFVHHKSNVHDGGWSILELNNLANSWVRNCTFKNVNRAVAFNKSVASTALNITIEGNIGHSSVDALGGSTGILLAKINDKAGMHHATGVGGGSTTGTVIWRSKHPAHTSFESHASQPRCTLFDNVSGGFFQGRAGGARFNLPNHGRHLVLWNYEETDAPEQDFTFVAKDTWWWKIVPPIIVGFHGTGTTFKEDEVQVLESLGKPVKPESLFEEQLKLRLGRLPEWIKQIK